MTDTNEKLYRVVKRSTSSLQPSATFWNDEILYCDYDRDEARRIYHQNTPAEGPVFNYGSPYSKTVVEVITDAGTDDFGDDVITAEEQ